MWPVKCPYLLSHRHTHTHTHSTAAMWRFTSREAAAKSSVVKVELGYVQDSCDSTWNKRREMIFCCFHTDAASSVPSGTGGCGCGGRADWSQLHVWVCLGKTMIGRVWSVRSWKHRTPASSSSTLNIMTATRCLKGFACITHVYWPVWRGQSFSKVLFPSSLAEKLQTFFSLLSQKWEKLLQKPQLCLYNGVERLAADVIFIIQYSGHCDITRYW